MQKYFRRMKQEWGIGAGISREAKSDADKIVFGAQSEGETDPGEIHDFYAVNTFLTGLAPYAFGSIKGGKTFQTNNERGITLKPLAAGNLPVAKRRGGEYAALHFATNGARGIFIEGDREAAFGKGRSFVMLPHPVYSQNFALASAHLKNNQVNSLLPFSVGFVNTLERGRFSVLDSVQANFSNRAIAEESPLQRKAQIMPASVYERYSHWQPVLFGHMLDWMKENGRTLVFPTPKQYSTSWGAVSESSASKIIARLEKALAEKGFRVRELTPAEEKRLGLQGAVGFKAAEPQKSTAP